MARALSLKEEVDHESLLCPLWVKSGHKTTQLGMSALPPKADIRLGLQEAGFSNLKPVLCPSLHTACLQCAGTGVKELTWRRIHNPYRLNQC